jgi:hypothetical protein
LTSSPVPKGVSDNVIRAYLDVIDADTTLTEQDKTQLLADKMVDFGVTPTQMARVTGAQEKEVLDIFKTLRPDDDPYQPVKDALSSPSLTQEQYNTLSGYFGNNVLPTDQNQIKDFVGQKTGFEFANYIATRDAAQGNTDEKKTAALLQSAISPFFNTKINYGEREVLDSETGQPTGTERFITDPITGRQQTLELIDPANNIYAATYGELGRASSDPEKTGYFPQVIYQLDDQGNATIVGGGAQQRAVSVGYGDFFRAAAGMTLMAFAPQLGPYLTAGGKMALSALSGSKDWFVDGLKSLAGSVIGPALQEFAGAGSLDTFQLADAVQQLEQGIPISQVASTLAQNYDLGAQAAMNVAMAADDALFAAADAKGIWDATKDINAVQQNLIASGVDSVAAADLANGLAMGKNATDLATGITDFYAGAPVYTSSGLLDGGSTMSDIEKGLGGNITNVNQPVDSSLLGPPGGPATPGADGTTPPGSTTPGGTTIPGIPGGGNVLDLLNSIIGGGAGGLFGNQTANQLAALLASGALTQSDINKLRDLGAQSKADYANLAQQATAGTQFTPYGVTTSLFGTQPTEGGITSTLTGQGQQLSDAALQAALSSYNQAGTMDLNQMAQERMGLYQQLVSPEQQRARLAAEARLAAQGRLGIGAGGGEYAPELKALEDAIAKQNLQFAIQAPQEALAQRTALLQQGASAAAIPTGLAGQQLQAGQLSGNIGQAASNAALQRGQLFGNLTGQGLADQLTANIAAAQISSERNKALGQALTGAFAPTTQQSSSGGGGGLLGDILDVIGLGNSSIYGDPALVEYLQKNRDPNNIV